MCQISFCLHFALSDVIVLNSLEELCIVQVATVILLRQTDGEKWKNKVIQREEFIVKESQRYNVSVLITHHQDFRKEDIEYC